MLHARFVEKFDVNPLMIVEALSIDEGADAYDRLRAALQTHNEKAVVGKAEGALIWSDKIPSRRYELRLDKQAVRDERYGDTENLIGFYTCMSGRKYWYYGKCVSWVPRKRSYWEIYLFHHDKKFIHDGIFTSKDLLARFDEDFLRLDVDIRLLVAVGRQRAEERIEEWDEAQGESK